MDKTKKFGTEKNGRKMISKPNKEIRRILTKKVFPKKLNDQIDKIIKKGLNKWLKNLSYAK